MTMIITVLFVCRPVIADENTPVINLGTFRNRAEPSGTPSGNVPNNDDRDISKARVLYSYKGRYEDKPVELTIICIHEAVSGREIPKSGYTVEYLNNDRPGTAKAIIRGINGYFGEQSIAFYITGDIIEQAPASSNMITSKRTVVPTSTKWLIMPDFNVARVRTTDGKVVAVSRVKDKSRSTKKLPWYYARIQVKKAGTERIILDGTSGESASYVIYSEAPKIETKALRVNDVCSVSTGSYISGTTRLKPVKVTSQNPAVATISDDNAINVLANGSSKITIQYPGRKLQATLNAKLPAFTAAKVTLKNRPKKLKMKNLPKGAQVVYRSSDENTVKVNPEGFAAPVANGTAEITGTTGNVTASCTVTVKGLK